jgi:hypothetical protein
MILPLFPRRFSLVAAVTAVAFSPMILSAQEAPKEGEKPAAAAEAPAGKPGTPEQRAAADELLKLSQMDKLMTESFDSLSAAQDRSLDGMQLPDEQKAKFMEMQKRTSELIKKELNWDSIREDVITTYVETFTEQELKGMVEFYKSDIGKKWVEKQPELMQKMMIFGQERMKALRPKIAEIATEVMGPVPGGPGAGGPAEAPAGQ